MKELKQKIKQEIIDIHLLFIDWFTGKCDQEDLDNKLAPRFYKETKFISTKGESINYDSLMMMFKNGYAKMNSDFKIAISDVELLQEVGDYVLVNYIEWQTNDPNPEVSGNYNTRKATVLISKQTPFKWLHIHETMLPIPEKIVAEWRT